MLLTALPLSPSVAMTQSSHWAPWIIAPFSPLTLRPSPRTHDTNLQLAHTQSYGAHTLKWTSPQATNRGRGNRFHLHNHAHKAGRKGNNANQAHTRLMTTWTERAVKWQEGPQSRSSIKLHSSLTQGSDKKGKWQQVFLTINYFHPYWCIYWSVFRWTGECLRTWH